MRHQPDCSPCWASDTAPVKWRSSYSTESICVNMFFCSLFFQVMLSHHLFQDLSLVGNLPDPHLHYLPPSPKKKPHKEHLHRRRHNICVYMTLKILLIWHSRKSKVELRWQKSETVVAEGRAGAQLTGRVTRELLWWQCSYLFWEEVA